MMRVIEIFHSIQGESTFAGLPTTFVRFARCDLRCLWCDTTYSFKGGAPMEREAIGEAIRVAGLGHVCLTGGEPLLQEELPDLCTELIEAGLLVSVETGGHRDISIIPPGVKRVLDLKTPAAFGRTARPASTPAALIEQTEFFAPNIERLGPDDELKIVLAREEELPWVGACLDAFDLCARAGAVHISPIHGALDPALVARWIVAERRPVRLHLQLHKLIFGAETRGV